jgi:hypothetical protein
MGIFAAAWYGGATVAALLSTDVASGDPISLFTSLGIGGIIAAVTYMWQRDTAKQRDKAMDLLTALSEGIRDIRTSVDKSTEAHREGTAATREMLQVLESLPPRETWVRIVLALEEKDRRRT